MRCNCRYYYPYTEKEEKIRKDMEKILLVDGNSIINRAFYGVGASSLKNAEGVPTGAVYGFLNIYLKVVAKEKPTAVCVAFDMNAPTFRHAKFGEYKAGRGPKPPELIAQFPILKDVLDAMNITFIEKESFEADDIIGTISKMATDRNVECVILTGDKDSLQLVDDRVTVLLPITTKGNTVTSRMDRAGVFEKLGVYPEQVVDLKAIMGDASDNIPGCFGIGEKGAVELISTYESIDNIYKNIDNIAKKSMKSKLIENEETVRLSYWLATINRDVPLGEFLPEGLDSLKTKEPNAPKTLELFKKLEFRKFISDLKLEEKTSAERALGNDDDEFSLFGMGDFSGEIKAPVIKREVSAEIDNPEDLDVSNDGRVYIVTDDDYTYVFFGEGHGDYKFRLTPEFLLKLKDTLEDEKIEKYYFDAKPFFLKCLRNGIKPKNTVTDIKICAYIADSTRKTENYPVAVRYFTGKSREDMKIMPETCEKALAYMKNNGFEQLLNEVEMPLIMTLAKMEFYGFRVNADVLREEGKKYEANLESLKKKIFELSGMEFNLNSPKQLGEVLFEKMQIPGGKKSKTGWKTGAEVLEELAGENEVIEYILEYRQNAKLKSNYIDGLLAVIDETGRVHSTFNQTVTSTGRLSSSEPNLQNIPVRHELGRVLRRAFVAENNDHVLVDADYSQIELRLLAAMSGDGTMINAFKNGLDIHALTASEVNGVSLGEVTHEMRTRAKAVNFGIVYGISEYGLSRDIKCSVYEAKRYIEGYFNRFPEVKTYLQDMKDFAYKKGYSETLYHRRRYIPELMNQKYALRQFGERVAMNMPVQGTAADIIKLAMIKVDKEIEKRGLSAKLLLQVHDELLIDCPKSEETEVRELLKECMENAADVGVPLSVAVTSGDVWEK